MVIIETSVFTRQVQALLADEEYRNVQTALANRPLTLERSFKAVVAYVKCGGRYWEKVSAAVCVLSTTGLPLNSSF